MNDLICFKGYRNGVTLILNDTEPDFGLILKQLKKKMSHLNFFKGAVINIDIGQRNALSSKQMDSLEKILSSKNIQIKNVNGDESDDTKPTPMPMQNVKQVKGDTLMINRTIRSGQSLSYPGNIMLIGDVHPGGEVFAHGHDIVWVSLGGVVHAGSCGDENAFIIALHLIPTQLRIAQYIAFAPEQALETPNRPEIAYLQKNRIVIEDYNNTKNKLANLS